MSEIRNEVLKLISLCNFDKIPKKFWKDKEIVLASVKKEGWALEYADEIFKKDKQIVLVAVKSNNGNPHNSGALKYAPAFCSALVDNLCGGLADSTTWFT